MWMLSPLHAEGWPEPMQGMEPLEETEGFFPQPYHGPGSLLMVTEPEEGEEEPMEVLRVRTRAR